MNKYILIAVTLFVYSALLADNTFKLFERPNPGVLGHTMRSSDDGRILLLHILNQSLPEKYCYVTFAGSNQITLPSNVSDLKNDTQNNSVQKRTSLNIVVQAGPSTITQLLPERVIWDEQIPLNIIRGTSATAYKALIGGGFDPFAHDGEVAFIFDASKQGRDQFSDVLIVPDGWGSHVFAAVAWRKDNNALFERKSLLAGDLLKLKGYVSSSSPLIRKMAMSLLIKHKIANSGEMKAWLKAEPTMVDVAVLTQLFLKDDSQLDIMVSPAWMIECGEKVWGGALIGATLLFTPNQDAVNSMIFYHAKMQMAKQVPPNEIIAFKKKAMSQVGFATIEGIRVELVRTNTLINYPLFSAANTIFSASKIIPPDLLFIAPPKQ